MEASIVYFAKSFLLGLLIGYLTLQFFRKGLWLMLFILLIILLLLFTSDIGQPILDFWSKGNEILAAIGKSTAKKVWAKIEPEVDRLSLGIGFLAGSFWSLFRK